MWLRAMRSSSGTISMHAESLALHYESGSLHLVPAA